MFSELSRDNGFSYACEHYMDTVYRLAVHNARSTADAEDVTQEVFEALLKHRQPFRDAEHLKAWLIRVTLNKCRSLHRLQKREAGELSPHLAAPPSPDGSVLDEVRALPEHYRSAIYLHYYEGYTAAEIGAMLRASPNTVLTWLSRGRKKLKERMIGGFDDE